MCFVTDPGYPMGVNPQDETSRKFLKCLINTRLSMDARTREERNIIFGKSQMLLAYSP